MAEAATHDDYIRVQGEEPLVQEQTIMLPNGSTTKMLLITHTDPVTKEKLVVPTTKEQYDNMGKVNIALGDRTVEFPTARLRRFHGDPCNQRSRKQGGKGYN